MIGVMSLIGIVVGAAIAYLAGRFPSHVEMLEAGGGALLIGGLALLGSAMPILP